MPVKKKLNGSISSFEKALAKLIEESTSKAVAFLETKFTSLEAKFTSLEAKFTETEKFQEYMAQEMDELSDNLQDLGEVLITQGKNTDLQIREINKRLGKLEKRRSV